MGNFRGRNLNEFPHPRKFSLWNLGMSTPTDSDFAFSESFLRKMITSYRSVKVFSLKRFPLYSILYRFTSGWPPFLNDSLMKEAFSRTLGPDGFDVGAFNSSIWILGLWDKDNYKIITNTGPRAYRVCLRSDSKLIIWSDTTIPFCECSSNRLYANNQGVIKC